MKHSSETHEKKLQRLSQYMKMPPNSTIVHISQVALHTPELFYHYFFVSSANVEASSETRLLRQLQSKVAERKNLLHEIEESVRANRAYSPTMQCLASQKDKCVKARFGQYEYSICILGEAKQDHVKLGSWEVDGSDFSTNQTVVYTGGQVCWNGIERTLTVDFECGEKEAITSLIEPSTCSYKAVMTSPCFCTEELIETISKKMD